MSSSAMFTSIPFPSFFPPSLLSSLPPLFLSFLPPSLPPSPSDDELCPLDPSHQPPSPPRQRKHSDQQDSDDDGTKLMRGNRVIRRRDRERKVSNSLDDMSQVREWVRNEAEINFCIPLPLSHFFIFLFLFLLFLPLLSPPPPPPPPLLLLSYTLPSPPPFQTEYSDDSPRVERKDM